MCGEKNYHRVLVNPKLGSPPRVRGKAPDPKEKTINPRITPACAGKSKFLAVFKAGNEDHPRVCGEKVSVEGSKTSPAGSPPRVRGKVFCSVARSGTFAITPACAGKSKPRFSTRERWEDHPRVCGEKGSVCPCRYSRAGSPPRVRGKGIRL